MEKTYAEKDIESMTEREKKYDAVIMGLGKTGISCARYMTENGFTVVVIDDNENKEGREILQNDYPEVEVVFGGNTDELILSAKKVIVSPGIPLSHRAVRLAKNQGIEVLNDIEIFLKKINVPVLAITGSNGKSTVASLITDMIIESGKKALLGGNIGVPVLDLLSEETPDYYVLELSSFQLESINSLNAVAAVLLNVSDDHADRYNSINEYAEVKSHIYTGKGVMIINKDDSYVAKVNKNNRKTFSITLSEPEENEFGVISENNTKYLSFNKEKLIDVSDISIVGEHNYINALAAISLGYSINLPFEAMVNSLKSFKGLPYRCQWVANINGVDWYNDSKATNVAATCSAVTGLSSNNIILIAGGVSKGADFSDLANVVDHSVRHVILIGKDAKEIEKVLKDKTSIIFSTDLKSAVTTANSVSKSGDIVLLSPACASFDMFSDYQHRGDVFNEVVLNLDKGRKT